jgi:hypothetical protein
MTTVAVKDGVLAADSFVSSSYGRKCIKLRKIKRSWYGVAGDWDEALKFFAWRLKGGEPPSFDDKIEALELHGKKCFYWCGDTPEEVKPPYAIGSGADLAMGAMAFGATAVEAVELACQLDDTSSGPVVKSR